MIWRKAAAALMTMRPAAQIDPARCTRRHASGCERCVSACPEEAIAKESLGVTIDTAACVGCGLCVTSCPADAISGVGQVPAALARRLAEGAALRCDVARLLDSEIAGPVVDVPCIVSVHPEVLAAGALAAGEVTVVPGPCRECPLNAGEQMAETVEEALAIIATSSATISVAPAVEFRADAAPQRRPERARPEVSRRSLFGLRRAPDSDPSTAAPPALESSATPREILLTIDAEAPQPVLNVDESCSACGGCATICPTDALTFQEGVLSFEPALCVTCDECVRICPERAMHRDGWATQPGTVLLVTVDTEHCDRCSRPLGPEEHETCHNCRARRSLAAGIL